MSDASKLTLPIRFLLATPEGREHGVRSFEIAAVAGARLHQPSMSELLRKGLIEREMVPCGTQRFFLYWRTPKGTALADAHLNDEAQRPTVHEQKENGPAVTRADIAYRATLRAFGLPECSVAKPRPPELCALPRAQRDAFEAAWTEALYAAAEAAGEPVARHKEPSAQSTRMAGAMAGKLGAYQRAHPVP
jgi:hypothetical protein